MICRGNKSRIGINEQRYMQAQSKITQLSIQPTIIEKIIFTGIVGPTGPQGPAGVQGIMGAPGPIGEIGPTGPAGPQGPMGMMGPTGATGPQGSADSMLIGNTSFSSNPNECKIIDRTGAPNHVLDFVLPIGEIGPTGPTGARGLRGERGPQGERGDIGPMGLTGPQGERGEKGDTGERGEKGEPGNDGVSEKISVVGTYTTDSGNEAEVVDNFMNNTHQLVFRIPRGATGPQGERGVAGPEGPPGERGEQGPAGEKGLKGDPGPEGPRGEAGPAGPSGLPAINEAAYFTAVSATMQNEPYFNMDVSYPQSQNSISLDIGQNSIKLKRGYYMIGYGTNVDASSTVNGKIWLEIDSTQQDATIKEGSGQGKYFLGGEFMCRITNEEATLDFVVNEDSTVRFSHTYLLIRKI